MTGKRLSRPLLATILASQAALACSLLVDTDGLSDRSQLAGDAGDGARNADGDVGGPDADAGTDGARNDAEGRPFCPLYPGAVFCADFDLSKNIDDGWTFRSPTDVPTGFTTALDPNVFVSPRMSAHLALPSAVPGFGSGLVNRMGWNPPGGFLPATTSVHIECEIRIDSLDAFADSFFFTISSTDSYAATLAGSRMRTILRESTVDDAGQGGQNDIVLPKIVPIGTWMHLDVDMVFLPTPSLTIKIDKALVKTITPGPGYAHGLSQVDIGPRYYSNMMVEATSIHYDNIFVEVK